jgi:hypothetical protein
MYNPKLIRTNENGCLYLEMNDKAGTEYTDGSIVKIKDKNMVGYVRYSFGRFEILCPFVDQRFVFGLNPDHTIIGHMAESDLHIHEQSGRKYAA